QVAERTVAHPRILELDAGGLDAAELASRRADIAPIALGRARNFACVANSPTVTFEQRSIGAVLTVLRPLEIDRKLELGARSRRKLGELQKRDALVVAVEHLPTLGDVLAAEPA